MKLLWARRHYSFQKLNAKTTRHCNPSKLTHLRTVFAVQQSGRYVSKACNVLSLDMSVYGTELFFSRKQTNNTAKKWWWWLHTSCHWSGDRHRWSIFITSVSNQGQTSGYSLIERFVRHVLQTLLVRHVGILVTGQFAQGQFAQGQFARGQFVQKFEFIFWKILT